MLHMAEPPFAASATVSHPLLPLPVSLSIHLCMLVLGMEHAGDMEEEETWRRSEEEEEGGGALSSTRH